MLLCIQDKLHDRIEVQMLATNTDVTYHHIIFEALEALKFAFLPSAVIFLVQALVYNNHIFRDVHDNYCTNQIFQKQHMSKLTLIYNYCNTYDDCLQ